MNVTTALAKQQRLQQQLSDLYSHASHFGLSSSDMEAKRRTLLEGFTGPRWVLSHLKGYWAARIEQAYRQDLVYGGFVGGVFRSTHRDREDYYEKHGIEPRAWAEGGLVEATGHYWKASLKPFFTGGA